MSSTDPLHDFFTAFDDFRATATDPAPISAALTAASAAACAAEPFDEALRYGNLRAPQFSVIGSSTPPRTRERLVASRPLPGYADTRWLAEALDAGAAVRVERPDLRFPQLLSGFSGLRDDLAAGRLAGYQLYLRPAAGPQPRSLRFDCGSTHYLVVQLSGATAWGGDGERLDPGRARHLHPGTPGDAGQCRALGPSSLLVLVFARPDDRSLRRALAEGFRAHLRDTGEAERHHLVPADAKADWLHRRLGEFLADPGLHGSRDRLDLLRPAAEAAAPTLVPSAVPDRGATAQPVGRS
jgi:hypothetical protein